MFSAMMSLQVRTKARTRGLPCSECSQNIPSSRPSLILRRATSFQLVPTRMKSHSDLAVAKAGLSSVVLDLVQLTPAERDVRRFQLDDEVADSVMLLVGDGKVEVGTTTAAVRAANHRDVVGQAGQLQMRASQVGQALLAAHDVVALAEDPQLPVQDLVEVVSLAHVLSIVGVEEDVIQPLEQLAPVGHLAGRADDRGQRRFLQESGQCRSILLREGHHLVEDRGECPGVMTDGTLKQAEGDLRLVRVGGDVWCQSAADDVEDGALGLLCRGRRLPLVRVGARVSPPFDLLTALPTTPGDEVLTDLLVDRLPEQAHRLVGHLVQTKNAEFVTA